MNLGKKTIFVYVLVFIISLIMSILEISLYITFAVITLVVLSLIIFPFFYTVLLETNIQKIEKFLINGKKDPNFQLTYGLANKIDSDVEEAIEKLLKKYKQKHRQALHKVIYALYKNDLTTVKEEIEEIKPPVYKYYYQALALLEEGNIEEAKQAMDHVTTPWMKSALLSELENKRNNVEQAKLHATEAMEQVKGMQRYLLVKTYEREFGEI